MAEHGSDSGRPPVRASDGDRQRVADLLRAHTSEGRLTIEEYTERVDAAYAARTVAELRPLLADLPVPLDEVLPAEVPRVPAVAQPPTAAWSAPRPEWVRVLLLVAAVLLVVGGLALASRGMFVFWPLLLIGIFVFSGGRRRRG
jgi:hypothetical protein